MKKLLVILTIFTLSLTSYAGIFGGGGGSSLGKILTILKTMKKQQGSIMDTDATILLREIDQVTNQLKQLEFEAQNINSWAATALKDTIGLTTQDINNLLEIKRMSGEIYRNASSFEKDFKSDFNFKLNKMSLEDFLRAEDKLSEKIDKQNMNAINFKKREQQLYDNLQSKMTEFNRLNSQTSGNLDSQQLNNEINANIYQSIEKLGLLIQSQKAEEELAKKREARLNALRLEREFKEESKKFNDILENNSKHHKELKKFNEKNMIEI